MNFVIFLEIKDEKIRSVIIQVLALFHDNKIAQFLLSEMKTACPALQ